MKSKTVSAKGKQECFCRELGGQGERDEGGETEARRTRGLDLRRREQLKVMMSAWPPRSHYGICVAPIGETRGSEFAGMLFAACLVLY